MVSLLKGLAAEKVVLLSPSETAKLPFEFGGIVRLMDKKGHTLGLVINRETIEEIEEEMEASDLGFLASLESSRRSGRVSGKEVKRRLRLK